MVYYWIFFSSTVVAILVGYDVIKPLPLQKGVTPPKIEILTI